MRPARYSHACWAAIKASEEALEAAIKAASENKKIETIDDPDDPPGE